MSNHRWARVLAFAAALPASAAFAGESREQVLEQRVQELERRLAGIETERGGYFTAASDLEARIAELERSSLDNKGGMNVFFKNGLKSESDDKAFSFQVYGRLQNDWVFWDADTDLQSALGTDLNGGTNFRRVRLGAAGTMYGNVKFKSELDFANSSVDFADVYVEVANCGFGNLRIGHFDEPFSVDRLTSSRFSTFIERNTIEAVAPQRNTGIMLHGNAAEDMVTYQLGMFRDADVRGADTGNAKSGEYNVTGRIAARPMVSEDGATYLHLGLAASLRDFSNDEVAFGSRPLVRVGGPNWVSTGTLKDISDGRLLGLEAAYVAGPITLKGEYATVSGNGASDTGAEDFDFDALSLEASFWLTGETTPYDKGAGRFDRPKVKKNYGDGEGMGAWQVAIGWDTIDLNDGPYAGGEMDVLRFGVNWWLNPNTRFSMNVVNADQKDFGEEGTALLFRFQVDF